MNYTTADTIAYRLSKMNPWAFVETTRRDNVPQHECNFCAWRKYINMHGMYSTHDPACLWVAAARYADELDNAPVASQEPADSPIESRVDELLVEAEDIKPCLFCCEPCPACFDFCDSCIEETTHYERIAMVREALSL